MRIRRRHIFNTAISMVIACIVGVLVFSMYEGLRYNAWASTPDAIECIGTKLLRIDNELQLTAVFRYTSDGAYKAFLEPGITCDTFREVYRSPDRVFMHYPKAHAVCFAIMTTVLGIVVAVLIMLAIVMLVWLGERWINSDRWQNEK